MDGFPTKEPPSYPDLGGVHAAPGHNTTPRGMLTASRNGKENAVHTRRTVESSERRGRGQNPKDNPGETVGDSQKGRYGTVGQKEESRY